MPCICLAAATSVSYTHLTAPLGPYQRAHRSRQHSVDAQLADQAEQNRVDARGVSIGELG